jgi:hypothetical protein
VPIKPLPPVTRIFIILSSNRAGKLADLIANGLGLGGQKAWRLSSFDVSINPIFSKF